MSGRWRSVVVLLVAGSLLPATASARTATGWRQAATPADRGRLRAWRTAWTAALLAARAVPEGAAAIAEDAALYDPDLALQSPLPPAGSYRCRTVKLGHRGDAAPGFVAYGWFRCRVGEGAPVAFAKLDGSQRQVGAIYPDTDARGVFLGALALGDEARVMDYGRDRSRDVAGVVERIGAARWRISFPYPAFESALDVMEVRAAE